MSPNAPSRRPQPRSAVSPGSLPRLVRTPQEPPREVAPQLLMRPNGRKIARTCSSCRRLESTTSTRLRVSGWWSVSAPGRSGRRAGFRLAGSAGRNSARARATRWGYPSGRARCHARCRGRKAHGTIRAQQLAQRVVNLIVAERSARMARSERDAELRRPPVGATGAAGANDGGVQALVPVTHERAVGRPAIEGAVCEPCLKLARDARLAPGPALVGRHPSVRLALHVGPLSATRSGRRRSANRLCSPHSAMVLPVTRLHGSFPLPGRVESS